ncbi:MAG: TetR/AcrR family transcriptional regulator [Pseudomonadota bacterium]
MVKSKPKGRPRADEVDQRIEHILTVAEGLFVRDGYQAVSVDEIARAAQISKKTIYTQFNNKAGLLAAVVDRLAGGSSLTLTPDPDQGLREGLLHCANVILDVSYDPKTIRFDILLFREGQAFPELVRTFENVAKERLMKPVEAFLVACAERGLTREADFALAAETFVYLLTADIISKTAMGEAPKMSTTDRRARAEKFCDLFVYGIQSSEV